jgi:DNA ligase (NAD+)
MKIEIPTECPSCNSKLELVNAQLFCRNFDCPARGFKKIVAFTKRMKIKGLGPATVDKLELGIIKDIYKLTESNLVEKLGEKIGKKIFDEIEKSKKCEFSTFLSALSIPLIGRVAAEKIAEHANSFDEIYLNIDNIKTVLGEKQYYSLIEWHDFEMYQYEDIFNFLPKKKAATLGKVCITGKLKDFANRTEAAKYLEQLGYKVTSTVNQQTNYLVDEEGKQSSKRKKAEQLNIKIVTIKQLEENIK